MVDSTAGIPAPVQEAIAALLAALVQADAWHGFYVREPTQAAFEAALDEAIRAGGGTVYLPNAAIVLTDTVLRRNMKGIVLRGQGRANQYSTLGCTRLVWAGPLDGRPMLDFSGASHCSLHNVGIFGNTQPAGTANADVIGLKVRGNGDGLTHGSMNNLVSECYFQNVKIGVQLGTAGDQVDTFTIQETMFYYDSTQDGVMGVCVNSTNSLKIRIHDCVLSGLAGIADKKAHGIHVTTGSVIASGNVTANNAAGFYFDNQPTGVTSITGHHSEGENYAVYTREQGNGQKANALLINGLYAYGCAKGLVFFGNANVQTRINAAYAQAAGGVDTIWVRQPNPFWFEDVTNAGGVKDITTQTTAPHFGSCGGQAPGVRLFIHP